MPLLSKKFLIAMAVFILLTVVGVFLYVQYLKAEIRAGSAVVDEEVLIHPDEGP